MKKDKTFVKKLYDSKKNLHMLSINEIYSMFEVKRKSEFYFEGECHSPWEMVYVIDGIAGITADDRIYTLSKGDIIFHKPMEFHKIWSAGGTSPRFLICSFDLEGDFSHRLRDGVFHLCGESKNIMDSLIEYLHSEFNTLFSDDIDYFDLVETNADTIQIIFNYLELIFIYISRLNKCVDSTSSNGKMKLYTEIVGILEEHVYENKITISQIAQMCRVSTATVKSCFSEYAGCGVHKYFLNIKIRTAIELLKSGLTVSEVSNMLQFENPNYFSYVFRRETGTCARSYKKIGG